MDKITIWGQTINLFLGTRRVAIFDFDGTLSDGSGRLHLLPTKDLHLTESWSEFNRAAIFDNPIQSTIDVMNSMFAAGYHVIILTGRSDEVRYASELWLKHHGARYDYLVMRPHTDNRKDTVMKEEAVRAIGIDNILAAWDDSVNIIKKFRDLGITTYQVCEYACDSREDLNSHGVD
ncbi:polynucleotide kinase [Escherichia phage T1]|uniref:3'-phosphatase, 5'-polynucleotide kinase n=3 Tax=Tunavirus T1 TaxID=1921008 RepID=A0A5B9MXR2_9CAUD|nr:polynucleotide kinase [Escherichia phage T1]AAP49936.1 polynucleotide kinase [Escherichia phage T1]AZS32497.1 putative polynucleotide kinase/phosphatase [Escherichia phage T1]QEG04334.1 3'-phosphatase, 5'-polynucleotide kinase [Tunavirus T1]